MEKVIMQLDTLSCPSCLQKIESGVSKAPGVAETKVMFNASKVKATYDPTVTNAENLQEIVEKLGYDVKSMKVKEVK